jgi:cell division septal protein FtsQ
MWFRRKPKNRRLGRDFVLDVKLRSSKVRAARTRAAAVALGACFGTVFGLFILWRTGEWALNRFVYENPAFAIQEIDAQTDGVIAVEQLRRWMGVKPGQNLLALDLARVKRDLELVPLVHSASVERILPHALRVRVIEREPLAQVIAARLHPQTGLTTVVYQLDPEGYVMLPLEPQQRAAPPSQSAEQLPLISGINANELQAGRRLDAVPVQAALQLIAAFDASPMAGLVDLKRVDVCTPETLVVTTGQGSEVVFGLSDLEQQLRRWRAVYELGQRMNKAIGTLDLAVTNNNPARWLEASAVPPAPVKAPKNLRNKKHHV